MKDLNKTIRRSQQYWFDDGLVELLIGLLFIILGLLFWWQITFISSRSSAIMFAIGFPLAIIMGALGLGWMLRWLKQRLVYPRTGYVTYQKPTRKRRHLSLLIGILVGLSVGLAVMVTQSTFTELTAVFIGAGVGVGLFMIGYSIGLLRFHLLAIWSVAVGVVVSFVGVADTLAVLLALTLVGGGLVLSGGFTFWRYWQNSEPGNDAPVEALS